MSRNLARTDCYFCQGVVTLDESPRPVTRADVHSYYDTHEGYGRAGMIAAHATCVDCRAKYLAHVDMTACAGYGRSPFGRWKVQDGEPFFDLSFRSSFNDEPGPDDMPEVVIKREWVIVSRAPWPCCVACGDKVGWIGQQPNACSGCMRRKQLQVAS